MRSIAICTLASLLAAGAAFARPGDLRSNDEHLQILAPPSTPCPRRICFASGAPSTIAADPASAPVAGRPAAAPVPRFTRAGDATWTLRVDARLKRPALAGNAVFLLYDADDRDAIANHTISALYQAPIPGGRALSARLILSPDDGVLAGHVYRLRVVQIVHATEVLLAEGEVELR